MPEYDLVIRGGTVIDGTGIPRIRADLAIKDGRVAMISGRINGWRRQGTGRQRLHRGPRRRWTCTPTTTRSSTGTPTPRCPASSALPP